ncbi:acyltransferase family protein [Uliginosibacterium sp. H3]|uniref:Acyltransferase family protein n=1 Tax=Uliginosibacterium silvisoli TaxID=3114758 RepID=A0ABU6K982_9RHOO|nr:acyltransferase family protein [Uliginosibacterium sp. H3]
MPIAPQPIAPTQRLAFLDPLRVALTTLVIAHHTSITYGGSGDWYYKEAGSPEWLRLLLSVFTASNQSFFMGFFFLLAGYFTPPSLAHKGLSRFVRERLWRLGMPLLLFALLLSPLTRALAAATRGEAPFLAALAARWPPTVFDAGPLWFCIALLLFTAGWIAVSRLPGAVQRPSINPHYAIALAVLGCGALAFALRVWVPVGRNVFSLQLGYFASYLLLFYGGCALAGTRALESVEWRHARPWAITAVLVFPTLWIYAALGGAFDGDAWRGGANLPALAYALWEPVIAAGVILASLAAFRSTMAKPAPRWRRLADDAFTAFVIHPPVVVACSALVRHVVDTPLLRFLLAAPLACLLAFALADAWRGLLSSRPS